MRIEKVDPVDDEWVQEAYVFNGEDGCLMISLERPKVVEKVMGGKKLYAENAKPLWGKCMPWDWVERIVF